MNTALNIARFQTAGFTFHRRSSFVLSEGLYSKVRDNFTENYGFNPKPYNDVSVSYHCKEHASVTRRPRCFDFSSPFF